MSKFSLEVLKRSVYPFLNSDDPDVILGATFGEDVALTRLGDGILASHVDPIVGAVNDIGWLAVHVACNDIATCGAPPRWIQLLVLVPREEDESLLMKIMQDAARAASEVGVSIIGGHTGYSASLLRPLVAVTALGTLQDRVPILTGGAKVGDHVLITKGIPLEGTAILASDFKGTALTLGLSEKDIQEAGALMAQVSVVPDAMALAKGGVSAMHDVTRGGLLETLLEMAALSDVEFVIDYEKVPISPIGGRFATAFNFDPLKMISSGTLVATVSEDRLADTRLALDDAGIVFADIGLVRAGQGVEVRRKGCVSRYDEVRPEEDELARMWATYKTDDPK